MKQCIDLFSCKKKKEKQKMIYFDENTFLTIQTI